MNKILTILFVLCLTLLFSQENEQKIVVKNNLSTKEISINLLNVEMNDIKRVLETSKNKFNKEIETIQKQSENLDSENEKELQQIFELSKEKKKLQDLLVILIDNYSIEIDDLILKIKNIQETDEIIEILEDTVEEEIIENDSIIKESKEEVVIEDSVPTEINNETIIENSVSIIEDVKIEEDTILKSYKEESKKEEQKEKIVVVAEKKVKKVEEDSEISKELTVQNKKSLNKFKHQLSEIQEKLKLLDGNKDIQQIFYLSKAKKFIEDSISYYQNNFSLENESHIVIDDKKNSKIGNELKEPNIKNEQQVKVEKELAVNNTIEEENVKVEKTEKVKIKEEPIQKTEVSEVKENRVVEKKIVQKIEKPKTKVVVESKKIETKKPIVKQIIKPTEVGTIEDTIIEKDEINADIIFDNKINTSIISESEKEAFANDYDSLKIQTNDSVIIKKEVEQVVIKAQKKKKYSFGDLVDRNSQEKGRFLLHRAKIEIDKGNLSKAKEYIDNSLKVNPSYKDAYIMKGDLYASLSYFDKALSQYHKASILFPNDAQLFYNMGNCFVRLNQEEHAVEEWSTAIKIDSNYILAYIGRASLLVKNKEFKRAISDYDRIFAINKYFYIAYKGRGVAYLELGEYESAILNFNNFLSYEPEDPFIFYKRGIAKLYDNEIYGGCSDLLSASEMGFKEADKALRKHCSR